MKIKLLKDNFINFYIVRCQFFIALILRCFLLALLLIIQPAVAVNEEMQHITDDNVLEVYVRDGCPHCAKAKEFLLEFSSERPWLGIVYRSLDNDPSAYDDLMQHSKAADIWPPGVPTFRFNDQLLVGFDSPEYTGLLLADLVERGAIDSMHAETSLFGTLNVSNLGLPLFTLAMGLLDGFNPCAMWVLLFLLSLLVHLQDRKRMALIAALKHENNFLSYFQYYSNFPAHPSTNNNKLLEKSKFFPHHRQIFFYFPS